MVAEQMPDPPMKPADADFFEWIEDFSPETWEHCRMYLYRLDPEVKNAASKNYLPPVYLGAVTRDQIFERHGGGSYRLVLNWKPLKTGIATTEFTIVGAPKFLPGQTFKATGEPAVNAPATAANGGANSSDTIAAIVRELAPLLRSDASQADAQAKVMDIMSKAQDKVLDMVTSASKKQVDDAVNQNSPNGQLSIVTAVLGLVDKLQPKVQTQPSIIAQLGELAPLLKILQGNQGGGGVIGEIREALGEKVVERIFNPESAPAEDWKHSAATALIKVVEELPTVLDQLITLQHGAQQPGAAPPPPPGSGPLIRGTVVSNPQAQPTASPSTTPSAGVADVSTAAQPAEEVQVPMEAMRDGAMKLIVQCFNREETGDDAVHVLSHIAEPMLAELVEQMRDIPLPAIMAWVRSQPQFAAIRDSPRLKTFVDEFREALMLWAEAQAEPDEVKTGN
jgi:hypothetical protein